MAKRIVYSDFGTYFCNMDYMMDIPEISLNDIKLPEGISLKDLKVSITHDQDPYEREYVTIRVDVYYNE